MARNLHDAEQYFLGVVFSVWFASAYQRDIGGALVDIQLPEGISRPQERQYDSPEMGAGGASFFPPLLPLVVIGRIATAVIGLTMNAEDIRSMFTCASRMY